jgi:hypothetical protein
MTTLRKNIAVEATICAGLAPLSWARRFAGESLWKRNAMSPMLTAALRS